MTNIDTHKEIGARVHDLAFRRDMEQADIADALGIHPSAVSLKVRGKRRWSVEELYALAALFDVPITDLLPEPTSDNGQYHWGHLAA